MWDGFTNRSQPNYLKFRARMSEEQLVWVRHYGRPADGYTHAIDRYSYEGDLLSVVRTVVMRGSIEVINVLVDVDLRTGEKIAERML
jgi:hypothetical protein